MTDADKILAELRKLEASLAVMTARVDAVAHHVDQIVSEVYMGREGGRSLLVRVSALEARVSKSPKPSLRPGASGGTGAASVVAAIVAAIVGAGYAAYQAIK